MALKYQRFKQTEAVFYMGDEGDRFFFLIQGECSVHIPILNHDLNPEDHIKLSEWKQNLPLCPLKENGEKNYPSVDRINNGK
jgi:hypothetical protein